MVNGAFEFDTTGMKRPPMLQQFIAEEGRARRVA
jgi:hypothetical protein